MASSLITMSGADWEQAALEFYTKHFSSAGASSSAGAAAVSGGAGGALASWDEAASGGGGAGGGTDVPTPASSGGGQQQDARSRSAAIVAMFGPNLRAAILSPENKVSSTLSCYCNVPKELKFVGFGHPTQRVPCLIWC